MICSVLAFVLVLTGASCSFNTNTTPSSTTQQNSKQEATVMLNFGPAAKDQKTFTTSISDTSTAFDVLKQAANDNTFTISYSTSDFGVYITEIDGTKSTNDRFWLVYVNDKAIEVAADKQVLKPSDKVEYRFEEAK